ncbi:MAG: thiamine phosphate synthase [Myxococcales bacterium]|nr:MAG: thiamine phosphate synthase [Myxococcales bacterium]
MTPLRGLYPIVDLDALSQRDISPLRFAEAVLTARPPLLQLRAKHQAPRAVLELLTALKPLCHRAGTRLFANDRPDLALSAETDGVHVGQDDVPLSDVRRLPGRLLVGVSTHDHEQLAAALAEKPDYAAFGPIFPTRSKTGADPARGLDSLAQAAELSRAAGVPLVAIGGLTLEVARELGRLGVVAAVISDLLAAGDSPSAIAERAGAWQRALT